MALVAYDLFIDDDGTALEDHVASDGGTWSKHPGSQAGSAVIDGGCAHNADDLRLRAYVHSWSPGASPDYRVACDVVLATDNNASVLGAIARIGDPYVSGYVAAYLSSHHAWVLGRFVGTGKSIEAIGAPLPAVLVPGRPYRVAVEAVGTTITGFVDGVPFATGSDAAFPGPGQAGLYVRDRATATTGLCIDDWAVDR